MIPSSKTRRLVALLLERHGQTFSGELGIRLERNTPAPLFRWLTTCVLLSARISSDIAMRAARELAVRGWTTPRKMAASTWRQRARALKASGYARYDERTSTMLGDTTALLLDEYRGDLRMLRQNALHQPAAERRLLKTFKGLGDVGVDVFFREIQLAWGELYPFADRKALAAAQHVGLGSNPAALARVVDRDTFPTLLAALVRASLRKDLDELVRLAR